MKSDSAQNKQPDMGAILREYVDEHRIRQAAWGRQQGVGAKNIARYLKTKDMRIHTLLTICRVLNYNFFKRIHATLPADMPPHEESQLQKENAELKLENEKLKEQVALLKEVIAMKS